MTETEQRQIFEEWISKHKGLLFKVIRAYAFDAMDRQDLFQEVTIQVWNSIPSFRHESAVTTWMYRVALNTAIKWTRKERKYIESKEALDQAPSVLQESPNPVDDRLLWLYKEIGLLNEIDRSITLLLMDGLSYKEMAAITGLTESHVGVKINRIKKYLASRSKTFEHHGI